MNPETSPEYAAVVLAEHEGIGPIVVDSRAFHQLHAELNAQLELLVERLQAEGYTPSRRPQALGRRR